MAKFQWAEPSRATAFPIEPAGYPFIAAAAFATAVFALVGMKVTAIIGLLLTLGICLFFRDPDRLTPTVPNAVVSPADGKVIRAEKVEMDSITGGPAFYISVFMSVFNVHVNRSPVDGEIESADYHPGKFLVASLDKASKDNERNALCIRTADGKRVGVVQIAGLVARRIICRVQKGDHVVKGGRFGLICFGSRLDITIPQESRIEVKVGDRVAAGTSILAFLE